MTLEEFIALPTTVDFYTVYNPRFVAFAESRPYIRIGNVLHGEYVVAYAPEDTIDQIAMDLAEQDLNIFPYILGLQDTMSLNAAGITRVQQPFLSLTGRGVVLSFVDTGIDYTHPAFRYEDGTTKIRAIWDQTIDGDRPPDIFYGAVYTREQINRALASDDPYAIVPHRDTVGHGTFLASVAASREKNEYAGVAPDAELLIVKLRKARPFYLEKYLIPPEQENAYQSSDAILGARFCLMQTENTSDALVFCIGLGSNFGSNQGVSHFEQRLTQLSGRAGIAFCAAAGNESNAKHHTDGRIERPGDTATIDIRVGEGAPSFTVNIWSASWDSMPVSVKSPTGDSVLKMPIRNGHTYTTKLPLESATIRVSYFRNDNQLTTVQVIDPTPGIWEITLYGDSIISGDYNAWLPLTGFISPEVFFVRPDPYNTIVKPGTALGAITCGAYNSQNNSLYVASSWGPTPMPRMSPDFVAPGVDVGGVYPWGYGTMTGTSVSAAIAAGACALLMQWGITEGNEPSMNGNRARALLIAGCERDRDRTYPNSQWGYGRLNLYRSFESLRGFT